MGGVDVISVHSVGKAGNLPRRYIPDIAVVAFIRYLPSLTTAEEVT